MVIQCLKILQIVIFSLISKRRVEELEDDREEFGWVVCLLVCFVPVGVKLICLKMCPFKLYFGNKYEVSV